MKPLIAYFDGSQIDVFGHAVRTPGLLLAVALCAGSLAALWKARRDGLDTDRLLKFLPWLFGSLFAGSALGYALFDHPPLVAGRPTIPFVTAGESSVGAILAAIFAGFVYFRRARQSSQDALRYADALAFGATLGWFFGRMGCFSVHDHPGVETAFWLAVYGICPSRESDVACHDLGLDEGLLALALFVLLVTLDRKPRWPGFDVAVVAGVYGIGRWLLDTLRHPALDPRFLGWTAAQFGALMLVAIAVRLVWKHMRP